MLSLHDSAATGFYGAVWGGGIVPRASSSVTSSNERFCRRCLPHQLGIVRQHYFFVAATAFLRCPWLSQPSLLNKPPPPS